MQSTIIGYQNGMVLNYNGESTALPTLFHAEISNTTLPHKNL